MFENSYNRRQFVTGAAATAVGAVALGASQAKAVEADAAFETTVEWDSEYDVVVVGFGGAGAAAAITAADAGAKTLLLEKAPKGESGGNSNVCMQWVCYAKPEDVEGVKKYFQALRGDWDTPSDEILDTYIEYMTQQEDWLNYLGAPAPTVFNNYIDFPEFEGADCYNMLTVDGNSGIKPGEDFGGGGAMYTLLLDNVESRADTIDVWYEAPAKHLIQDPATKIVHGVVVEVGGKEVKVRAKNGVVLACGGFESNPKMQQDYSQRKYWPSLGHALYNEGDGIKMALEINADLWHMSNVVTNNQEFYDETTHSGSFAFAAFSPFKGIFVGPNGARVYDGRFAHGKQPVCGEFQNASVPGVQYYIWDQAMQDLGPANQHWSADSSEEIEKGWVMKADTLEDLAAQIGYEGDAVDRFVQTITDWNGDVAAGVDRLAGRAPEKMFTIEAAPFYACKITPQITNTQGGPRKNEKGEVLDLNGDPIPHLFEAGELGDIWSNMYQAGNNLGGGQIFGRISGANAAAVKDDVTQDDLVADGFKPEAVEPVYEAGDGQFVGLGKGKSPQKMAVRVTMDGDKIANVEILEQHETVGLPGVDRALANLPQAVIDANGLEGIDIVGGATRTTAGFFEAVTDALTQAGR